jgi:hypothetical protein
MEKTFVDALAVGAFSLVGGWLGSYLGAYLKKKGENLATREDLDKLVEQVAAVTKTTKEIEAKISDEVWDRQKRWELKRDAIFEIIRELGTMEVALGDFFSVFRVAGDSAKTQFFRDRMMQEHENFQKVHQSFERAKAVAMLVCSEKTQQEFRDFGVLRTQFTSDISAGRIDKAKKDFPDVVRAGLNLRESLRTELLGNQKMAASPQS